MPKLVELCGIAELVNKREIGSALDKFESLWNSATCEEMCAVVTCANAFVHSPKVAAARLKGLMRDADESTLPLLSILELFAPRPGEQRAQLVRTAAQHPDEPQPFVQLWADPHAAIDYHSVKRLIASDPRPVLNRAPRDCWQEIHPEQCRAPKRDTTPRPVRAYFDDERNSHRANLAERLGILPEEEAPVWDDDTDNAPVPPMRGTACVNCFCERANADRKWGHDDGLCAECRGRAGVEGIPALPPGHSRAQEITARCATIARNHPTAMLPLLRLDWQRLPDSAKVTVTRFVERRRRTPHHLNAITARTPGDVRQRELISARTQRHHRTAPTVDPHAHAARIERARATIAAGAPPLHTPPSPEQRAARRHLFDRIEHDARTEHANTSATPQTWHDPRAQLLPA